MPLGALQEPLGNPLEPGRLRRVSRQTRRARSEAARQFDRCDRCRPRFLYACDSVSAIGRGARVPKCNGRATGAPPPLARRVRRISQVAALSAVAYATRIVSIFDQHFDWLWVGSPLASWLRCGESSGLGGCRELPSKHSRAERLRIRRVVSLLAVVVGRARSPTYFLTDPGRCLHPPAPMWAAHPPLASILASTRAVVTKRENILLQSLWGGPRWAQHRSRPSR